jgi:hypothetical protein
VALTDGERALQIRVKLKLNVTLILDLMHVLRCFREMTHPCFPEMTHTVRR